MHKETLRRRRERGTAIFEEIKIIFKKTVKISISSKFILQKQRRGGKSEGEIKTFSDNKY